MNSENTEDEPPNTSAVEKALETYLRAENDKLKQKLFEKKNKVEELKETVRNGLIRRKELKKKIEEESQKQTDLGTTLASLEIYNRQLTDQIMLRKANVGSDVVLWHLSHVNEYGAIVNMYREKWAQYEAEYEKRPLAIARKKIKFELERVKIQLEIEKYKAMEFKKAVQQKKKIDQMRIRIEIIKLAKLWLDRKKEEQHLQGLLQTINNLKMVEAEYNAKVAKAVEERRAELRDRQIFGRSGSSMPKIDLSSIKKHWYIQNTKNPFEPFNLPMQIRTRTIDADEMSVNSLMLEEMCTEDNTTMQHVPLSNASITEEVEEQQEPAQSLAYKSPDVSVKSNTASVEQNTLSQKIDTMNIQDNVNRNKHATTQGEADFNYSDKQDIQTVSDEAVSAKENVIEHRQADKRMKDIVREMAADAVEPAKQVLSPILEETKVSNESSAAKHPKITNVETVHYNLKKVHTVVPGSPLENGSFIDQFRINSELEISNLSVLYDQAMTNRRGFPLSPGGGSVNEESMIGLQYPSARHCVSPAASEHQSDNGGNYKDPAQKTENNFPAANSEFTFTMFGQRGTGGGDNFF